MRECEAPHAYASDRRERATEVAFAVSPYALAGVVAIVGFALSLGMTVLVRRLALTGGFVAPQRNDRWHQHPTPFLGGIAIVAAFFLAAALGVGLFSLTERYQAEWSAGAQGTRLLALGGAGLLMFLTGLRDDLRNLMPGPKLALQLVAAAALVASGISFRFFDSAPLDILLSLFWFVGMTNAVNLLDNMDGLAGGVATIAACCLGILFLLDGEWAFAILAFALAGAVSGFLVHNVRPASIFMGDSGALFLGVFLAGLALAPAPGLSRGLLSVIGLPVLILAIPILDTALVTAGRIAEGRPVYIGGKDHVSHRLVGLGLSEGRVVGVLWGLAAAGGGVGLLVRSTDPALAYVLGAVLLAALALLGAFLLGGKATGQGAARPVEGRLRELFLWTGRSPLLVGALDAILLTAAYYAAYQIRWDPVVRAQEIAYLGVSLPFLLVAKIGAFAALNVYREDLRFFSSRSVMLMLRANGLGSLLFFAAAFYLVGPGLSRGVVLLDFGFATLLTGAARASFRMFAAAGRRLEAARVPTVVVGSSAHLPVLLAHLRSSPGVGIAPVAFVDPSLDRSGRVLGVPRFGGATGLDAALAAVEAKAILVMEEHRDPTGEDHLEAIRRRLASGPLPVYQLRVELRSLGTAQNGPEGNDSVGFMRH